ncbi:sphingolipid delta8-desaturase [Ascoidea rubescens DSM 1968]|uniref:Delta 8-(E)-sphingolipid desaturase n=1 Tax=Ascoidea rubescens DSM 1968 TaxID=1344418 RepID=A0A1D2VS52_9ASCO|nr:sphingolipid delta8-desaturase [Ascoidea rubescens DSM 1968]ODV64418.1 sphingolipid delta8-desaturase [Ascoidea rubescens DSM 1968]
MSTIKSRILSKSEIEHRIATGDAIVIYQDNVLKLNKWIDKHPGGDKAVYHLIGRDATDEMISYHCDGTQSTFLRWSIGKIDHKYKWENFLPPIQGGIYRTYEEQNQQNDSETSTLTASCTDSSTAPIGTSSVKIIPKAPQCEILTKEKFYYFEKRVIRDPEDVIDNYDNDLAIQDLNSIPSLDYKTQEFLSKKYNQLHENVIAQGFYQCNYWCYFKEFCRISSLMMFSASLFKTNHLFFSAVLLGAAWQQMTFIAHDAGHISITHNYQIDNLIGMTVADWFGGLSLGWWKRNHNVHHLITNDPIHDPDIQHLPFFAVSTRLFKNVYSTYYDKYLYYDKAAQYFIKFQDYLYYPVLCFGRFNLYRLSWTHLLLGLGPRKGKAAWFRYYELLGLSFFFYWFFYLIVYSRIDGWGARLQYVLVSHITTMVVHVQITLSHFAMSTSDLGVSESFVSKQLRTTMDVDCPEWFDYFHGGLQYQAIHHLFPRVPRHNFRKLQPLIIDFCNEVGLKYTIYGFGKGNKEVINKLGEIARQAKILADCTKSMKKEAQGFKRP